MEEEISPPERLIYSSGLVSIGLFRLHPRHPNFEDTGPTRQNLLVFPRTSVTITHAGSQPVVASPNVVMFYNTGQPYRRGRISTRGDHCEWFSFDTPVLAEALAPHNRRVESRPEQPFGALTHAFSDSSSYLLQRRVVEHILETEHPDRLFVEETMLQVLNRILERAFRGLEQRRESRPCQRKLILELKGLLAARFGEALTLEEIAAELHYSPFHLCRLFQKETGASIHQYLNRLRLRTALEWVGAGADLGELALSLGYSSHSHFTQAFRKEFGLPPSSLRSTTAVETVAKRTGTNWVDSW